MSAATSTSQADEVIRSKRSILRRCFEPQYAEPNNIRLGEFVLNFYTILVCSAKSGMEQVG